MSSQLIDRVLELTNAERVKAGLKPLTLNNQLSQAAQGHSDSMAADDFFSHTGVDGSDVSDRVQATGYQYSYTGENIAAGQKTAEEVVQGWMDSPGHRANILNAEYTEIGIGYELLENDTGSVNYNHYWTQVFGSDQGNSNQPNLPEEENNNPITVEDNSGNSPDMENPNFGSYGTPDPENSEQNNNPELAPPVLQLDNSNVTPCFNDNLTGNCDNSIMTGGDNAVNFPDKEVLSDKNQFNPNNYNCFADIASFAENLGLGNSDCDLSNCELMFSENFSCFELNQDRQQQNSENIESLF